MKTCTMCKLSKSESGFYPVKIEHASDGLSHQCRECRIKLSAERYSENKIEILAKRKLKKEHLGRRDYYREYIKKRRENPEERKKMNVRQKLRNAIRDGRIEREACRICGNTKSEAHHDDYDKPFEVKWLCRLHHQEEHGRRVS